MLQGGVHPIGETRKSGTLPNAHWPPFLRLLLRRMASRTRHGIGSLLLLGLISISQGSAQEVLRDSSRLAFEVASVKPYKSSIRGGSIQVGWCRGTDSSFAYLGSLLFSIPITPPGLGRCDFIDVTLRDVIWKAYFSEVNIPVGQAVIGGPDWISEDRFEIHAKAEDANTTQAKLMQMLQPLLQDRFKLSFHRESKEVSGYALVVEKNGLRIMPTHGDEPPSVRFGSGGLKAENATMSDFVRSVPGALGGPVIDKTGLVDKYNFTIPYEGPSSSILWQVQELGLRFESVKLPVEIIVVDHAEKPTVD
jgi:uncharacterized protein (TIGR03435 family)